MSRNVSRRSWFVGGMSVASREGEVTFEGRLSADGKSMFGIVNYHGGVAYPMVATLRPKRTPAGS